MSATAAALSIAVVLLASFLLVVAARALRTWLTFRGERIIECPETHAPAVVQVDAAGAAATSAVDGNRLVLAHCSRWPEKAGCGQECLAQVEAAPEACLVHSVVSTWFEGKACVYCGKALHEPRLLHQHSALLGPNGVTTEWSALPAEQLPALFKTHVPVCWDCHIAESFRREHPELVTDRPVSSLRS